MRRTRTSLATAVLAAGVVAGLTLAVTVTPTAVTAGVAAGSLLALVVGWPSSRDLIGVLVALPAAAVLLATFALPDRGSYRASAFVLAAVLGLLVLVAVLVRWADRRVIGWATPSAGAAVVLWTLPADAGQSVVERAGWCALWTAPLLLAAATGWYGRTTQRRTETTAAAARTEQRLQLSRDLHDYVAHDISGIVAQAQAARYLADTDPAATPAALARIEHAGIAALAAIDNAVQALEDGTRRPARLPSLQDVADLVERFGASGRARVDVALEPALDAALPRSVVAVVHRVVAEALTNVRRHAPGARVVRVEGLVDDGTARVAVTDDGGPAPGAPRDRAGSGLDSLRERVHAVGGRLTAGPTERGWQVVAVFPRQGEVP